MVENDPKPVPQLLLLSSKRFVKPRKVVPLYCVVRAFYIMVIGQALL